MKKFFAILLSIVLMLSLTVPASAAMEGELTGGSITINDAISGQTYSAYQILYLESYSTDANGNATGAYAYKANSAWAEWLGNQTNYVSIDDQGYVTWVEGADVATFAKLAQAQLEGKTADKTAVAPKAAENEAYSTVTLSGLNLGYYLVDTTLGTLCSLDTTNPNVIMKEKNEAPSITKEVQEDSKVDEDGDGWGASNDADTNQVVNFKATVTVQAGAENYIVHDKMSAGLTYTGVTSVKIGDADVDADDYTVTTSDTCGCTFEVAFDNEYIASLEAGTEIVVSYSATLNEEAVVGLSGNPNEVTLQYGDKNQPSYTPKAETVTYTWDAKVVKYTKNGETEVVLAGAAFKLSTDDKGENVLKFHSLGENQYEFCADENCEKDHVTEITTDATGIFRLEGLDSGTYYLTETAAPAGYNKLAAPVTVEITGAVEIEKDGGKELTYTTVETKVLNQSGTELPETGGMGTTIFYVVGGLLAVGAAVLLITKKRMSAEG